MSGEQRPEPPKDPRASGMVALAALVVVGVLVVIMVLVGG